MFVNYDGNRYEGGWAKDKKHGKGRYLHLDSGQVQDGVWQEDVCVFSTVRDIPFRQTSVLPTPYPIRKVITNNICNIKKLMRIKYCVIHDI